MNCTINSASNFSGLQAGISQISPAQLAAPVRKSTLNRPFISPILAQTFEHTIMESGIAKARAKAMVDTDNLTLEDMINLGSFLTAFLYDYHHDYEVLVANGNSEYVPALLDDLAEDTPVLFGNRFSRAWFLHNKYWMHPDLVAAIDRGMKDVPIGTDLAYYQKIQASALALK